MNQLTVALLSYSVTCAYSSIGSTHQMESSQESSQRSLLFLQDSPELLSVVIDSSTPVRVEGNLNYTDWTCLKGFPIQRHSTPLMNHSRNDQQLMFVTQMTSSGETGYLRESQRRDTFNFSCIFVIVGDHWLFLHSTHIVLDGVPHPVAVLPLGHVVGPSTGALRPEVR